MRRLMAVMAGLVLVGGCGTSGVVVANEPAPSSYSGPLRLPVAQQGSVMDRSGAAGRALQCTHAPYAGGSGDYAAGLASTQRSAGAALRNFFSLGHTRLPKSNYRMEREEGGRVLYSYNVGGRTKVALIAADAVRDFNQDEGWGVETWAQCDPSELPAEVTDALDIQVWKDASGKRVPVTTITSRAGPEHCDWQDITFLDVDTKSGEREYLRDTTGELGSYLTTTFDASATVPKQAIDTGYERDGRHLWLHPDGTAAYLVNTLNRDDVERWPAARRHIACA